MKRTCFLVFLILIGTSFAVHAQNRSIFIEGSAASATHLSFFLDNFRMEGAAAGYNIVNERDNAVYIFRFEIVPNIIVYDDGTRALPLPDEPQFNIIIMLINNADGFELISFGFPFSDLNEMYEYTQFLFLRAALNIPNGAQDDDSWQNKWVYLRASANYRITFLTLNDNNLIDGTKVYDGTFENPTRISPIDNRITALPGVTLGLEIQPLNWLSIEPNFQMVFGDSDQTITMAAGAELKFPIKLIKNVVLSPYGAFFYPLTVSPAFSYFPPFTVGGGIQTAIRGGNMGAFFVDLNLMLSLRNAALHNPYGDLFPNPEEIHYMRFVIGIGIGYKVGFLDRR